MSFKGSGPSQKVFYYLIATVFVVVFSISYNSYRNRNPRTKNNNTNNQETLVSITNPISGVTNTIENDRFVNWEETLSKSLEEETVMGESIFLEAESDTHTANASERAIRNLLENMAGTGEGVDIENFAEQIIDETSQSTTYESRFSAENITVIENTDENIRQYINDFLRISTEEYLKMPEMDPNDFEKMAEVMPGIYETLSLRLATAAVPEDLSNMHLNYINSLFGMSHYGKILGQEREDPLLAYSAIPGFQQESNLSNDLYTQIISYPENNGIIFEEEDFAYEFYSQDE